MTETHILTNGSSITLYPSESPNYLLYLHGGGLVYGSRSDIPEVLVKMIQAAGYTVITMDYLLAPNNNLFEIVEKLWESFLEIKKKWISSAQYSICGRSAGSYLMFLLAKQIQKKKLAEPTSLINFYGYYDLAYIDEKRNLTDQTIKKATISSIDQTAPKWDDPYLQRYLLYLYGVQEQLLSNWYNISPENMTAFQLTEKELSTLPPLFSTASTSDAEVPFRYSKTAAKKNRNGVFVPAYYLEHDFLKSVNEPEAEKVLDRLKDWLHTK